MRAALAGVAALLAAACSSPPARIEPAPGAAAPEAGKPAPTARKPVLKRGGGFYKDDGPADDIPVDLDAVADAVPRWEPLHKGAQKPYVVLGQAYVPNTTVKPYKARGVASWYGRKFHGQKTSIGEPYDMFAMTAAHTTLALPSYVRVSNPDNGRSVVVRVTDRGPFHQDRLIDLSYTAAYKLGLVNDGSGVVEVEAIIPGDATATTYAQVAPPTRGATRADVSAEAEPTASSTSRPADDELGDLIKRLDRAETPAPATATGRGTWLQLGAFSNPDNAESLRGHLARELDWLAEPVQIHVAAGIQRVQVGPYNNRADADKIAERIRAELGTRPTIVVR